MRSRRRLVVILVLAAQLLAGTFAHVAAAQAAASAPCHAHSCCAGGDCACPVVAAIPATPSVALVYLPADPAISPAAPAPLTTRLTVLLRPPIA